MKKYFLLIAVIASSPSFAGAATEDFANMNCTDAIAWTASQIILNQPPNTMPLNWKKGQAQTLAIELISMSPQSPCRTNSLPEKNPASDVVDGKNGGAFMHHRSPSFHE